MAKKKTDWEKIKNEYVTQKTSYRKLSEKYKVSLKTIAERGKREGWVELREHYGHKVATKFLNKQSTKDANKLAALTTSADKLSEIIESALEDTKQFNRYIVKDSNGSAREKIFEKYDTGAIKELVITMRELAGLIRSLNNIDDNKITEVKVNFSDFENEDDLLEE